MKLLSSIASLTKRSSKTKKGIICAILLSIYVLVNVDDSFTRRFLQETYESEDGRIRYLSKDLGGGACEWLAPELLSNTLNTTTLLAAYPGSGKRLTWRLLEALTGKFGKI